MKQWRSSFLLRGLLLAGLAAAKVAGECDRPSDVVFVIDGSGSITDANFKLVRGLVTDIAQRFQINPPDGIQMGIVEFGSAGQLWLLQLNASTSTPYFVDQVQNKMPYLDGSTCTRDGVLAATQMLQAQGRPAEFGSAHLALVITDGQSNGGCGPVDAAIAARAAGITVAVATIGPPSAFNPGEITGLSGGDASLVFAVEDWAALSKRNDSGIVANLTRLLCDTPIRVDDLDPIDARVTCNASVPLRYTVNLTQPVTLRVTAASGGVTLCFAYAEASPDWSDVAALGPSVTCTRPVPGSGGVATSTAYPPPGLSLRTALHVSVFSSVGADGACGSNFTLEAFLCSTPIANLSGSTAGNSNHSGSTTISVFGDPSRPQCAACPPGMVRQGNVSHASSGSGSGNGGSSSSLPDLASDPLLCAPSCDGGSGLWLDYGWAMPLPAAPSSPSPSPSQSPSTSPAASASSTSMPTATVSPQANATAGASPSRLPSPSATPRAAPSAGPKEIYSADSPMCSACDASCGECVAPGTARSCTACPPGQVLLPNAADPSLISPYWQGEYAGGGRELSIGSAADAAALWPALLPPSAGFPYTPNANYRSAGFGSGLQPVQQQGSGSGSGGPVMAGRCVPVCPPGFSTDSAHAGGNSSSSNGVLTCDGQPADAAAQSPTVLVSLAVTSSASSSQSSLPQPAANMSCDAFAASALNAQLLRAVSRSLGVPPAAMFLRACLAVAPAAEGVATSSGSSGGPFTLANRTLWRYDGTVAAMVAQLLPAVPPPPASGGGAGDAAASTSFSATGTATATGSSSSTATASPSASQSGSSTASITATSSASASSNSSSDASPSAAAAASMSPDASAAPASVLPSASASPAPAGPVNVSVATLAPCGASLFVTYAYLPAVAAPGAALSEPAWMAAMTTATADPTALHGRSVGTLALLAAALPDVLTGVSSNGSSVDPAAMKAAALAPPPPTGEYQPLAPVAVLAQSGCNASVPGADLLQGSFPPAAAVPGTALAPAVGRRLGFQQADLASLPLRRALAWQSGFAGGARTVAAAPSAGMATSLLAACLDGTLAQSAPSYPLLPPLDASAAAAGAAGAADAGADAVARSLWTLCPSLPVAAGAGSGSGANPISGLSPAPAPSGPPSGGGGGGGGNSGGGGGGAPPAAAESSKGGWAALALLGLLLLLGLGCYAPWRRRRSRRLARVARAVAEAKQNAASGLESRSSQPRRNVRNPLMVAAAAAAAARPSTTPAAPQLLPGAIAEEHGAPRPAGRLGNGARASLLAGDSLGGGIDANSTLDGEGHAAVTVAPPTRATLTAARSSEWSAGSRGAPGGRGLKYANITKPETIVLLPAASLSPWDRFVEALVPGSRSVLVASTLASALAALHPQSQPKQGTLTSAGSGTDAAAAARAARVRQAMARASRAPEPAAEGGVELNAASVTVPVPVPVPPPPSAPARPPPRFTVPPAPAFVALMAAVQAAEAAEAAATAAASTADVAAEAEPEADAEAEEDDDYLDHDEPVEEAKGPRFTSAAPARPAAPAPKPRAKPASYIPHWSAAKREIPLGVGVVKAQQVLVEQVRLRRVTAVRGDAAFNAMRRQTGSRGLIDAAAAGGAGAGAGAGASEDASAGCGGSTPAFTAIVGRREEVLPTPKAAAAGIVVPPATAVKFGGRGSATSTAAAAGATTFLSPQAGGGGGLAASRLRSKGMRASEVAAAAAAAASAGASV